MPAPAACRRAGDKLPLYNTVPTDMPQGSMLTTGSDMPKFMLAQLNQSKLGEAQILRGKTVKEMQSVQRAIHPKVPTMAYGFEFPYAAANVVGSGFHGPDVQLSADGAADYRPKQAMTRQEGSALLYRLATASLLP